MKKQRKITLIALALICAICAAFAFGCSQEKVYYTVTFMDGQTQVGQPVQVEKGKRIEDLPVAERSDPNYVFDGWYKDEGLTKIWDNSVERVTKDTTLWANFLYVSVSPSNAAMENIAFSNTLTWLQRGANADSDISVELIDAGITSQKQEFVFENYKGHADVALIKWTPAVKPVGGTYSAKITSGEDEVTFDGLLFKGAGTEENPYLLTNGADLAEINAKNVAQGNYYKLKESFKAKLSATDVKDNVFNADLNGNGKTVTLEGSDVGLFGALGESASVKDLTVAGAVANVQTNCVGAIAGVNRGEISYCTVSATLDSAQGAVGTLTGGKDGIEGGIAGIAGINYGDISCCTYSGTVKANVGGAGITVINNGTVSLCAFTGTIGAGNATETGNSTKAYSYIGGIAAINYATVEKSFTDGSGKLLAQRGDEGLNDFVGGIVALNQAGATVTECWFDGIRVHGNRNVGGIAGANAGAVTYCYAGGDYHSGSKYHSYVGGLAEVGGIVGLSQAGGSVSNCFVTSNVYAYSGNAYKVAANASNCVYLGANLDNRDGVVAVKDSADNGNTKIELSGDYSAKHYPLVLTDGQLSALNGANALFENKDDVSLICESENRVVEHVIALYIGTEKVGDLSSITGNDVGLKPYTPADVPGGKYFAGWAVKENGEVVFEAGAQVNYTALSSYGDEKVTLYPVFADGENPLDKVLDVAVYAQYVKEDMFISLLDAFKTYCNQKNIDITDFSYTMIGDENTKVGDFCTAVSQGDYNIIFGHRANLTISVIGNVDTRLKVNGTARRIAKISEGTASNAFYDFVLNDDAAKKILDPEYISEAEADTIEITLMNGETQYGGKLTVSNATDAVNVTLPTVEGENFAGWALTAQAVENETLLSGSKSYADLLPYATEQKLTLYARFTVGEDPQSKILNIAVYGKFMLDETAESLINTFKTTYAAELDGITVKYTIITKANATNNAAFAEKVLAGDAGDKYDIAIGYKHTSKAPVEVGQTENLTVNMYNKDSATENEARHVCIIGNDESATKFIEFLNTDAAKEILLIKPVEETV